MAITREQITQYQLPTRPTKRDRNSHAKKFRGDSVELDALPADVLLDLVRTSIVQHIDPHQLEITQLAEASEREVLMRMIRRRRRTNDDERR